MLNTIANMGILCLQGGAYLTLLNTIANMGIILPKAPAYYLIDALTATHCSSPGADSTPSLAAEQAETRQHLHCPKKLSDLVGNNECTAAGGWSSTLRGCMSSAQQMLGIALHILLRQGCRLLCSSSCIKDRGSTRERWEDRECLLVRAGFCL